ncbi:peptidase family M16-domain-containing protein [Gloeopeniophorella convolvens]|nr:peptidase family M16-domain-containing protein [Gloeopeniophorella convolvens]
MLRATRLVRASSRGFATVVDAASGFKVAAVDNGQPTSSVTVLLKAGTRYESKPGVAHVLSNFAFKSTGKRSALGTVREAELYGGVLSSSLSREHLAVTAEFLRGDECGLLVDVLASFIASPKFTRHELANTSSLLSTRKPAPPPNQRHLRRRARPRTAFRNGLGHSLYADAHTAGSVTAEDVRNLHAQAVGSPSSVARLASHKAAATPARASPSASATSYHGGSTRLPSGQDTQAIFVGYGTTDPASVPALHALAAHLDPTPSLNVVLPYSDATLVGVLLEGSDAAALKTAAQAAVNTFKDAAAGKVGKEELARAVARARFQLAAGVEGREGYVAAFGPKVLKGEPASVQAALEGVQGVTGSSLTQAASTLVKGKPTYVAVGDLHALPFADEIGLNA